MESLPLLSNQLPGIWASSFLILNFFTVCAN